MGTGNSSVITIGANSSLSIYDCNEFEKSHYYIIENNKYEFKDILETTENAKTIYGGVITDGIGNEGSGGGIEVSENATLNLYGGNISGNSASSNGGGIHVEQGGHLNIFGGTISGNTSEHGGGVYAQSNSVFYIYDGEISHNNAQTYGGGVRVYSCSFYMFGGKISNNNGNFGGGLSIDAAHCIIENGSIEENIANYGGGIEIYSSSSLTMNGGKIINNKSNNNGGGVWIWQHTTILRLNDGIISGNINGNNTLDDVLVRYAGSFEMNGGYVSSIGIEGANNILINGGYFNSGNLENNTVYGFTVNNNHKVIKIKPDEYEYNYFVIPSDYTHSCNETNNANIITTEGGELTEGHYSLVTDVVLTNNITIAGNVTICLNGYKLIGTEGQIITIEDNGSLILTDCNGSNSTHNYYVNENGLYVFNLYQSNWNEDYQTSTEKTTISGGIITGGNCGVLINSNAVFTMKNGTISGNSENNNAGGVFVFGEFNFIGGNIIGNNSNNIVFDDNSNFNLEGGNLDGTINSLPANINITSGYLTENSYNSLKNNINDNYIIVNLSEYVNDNFDPDYNEKYPYAIYKRGVVNFEYQVEEYIYTGNAIELNVTSSIPSSIHYSYSNNIESNFVEGLPTLAGQWYIKAETANYHFTNDTGEKIFYPISSEIISIEIKKATPYYTAPSELTAIEGQTLSQIALPQGWMWENEDLIISGTGEQTFTAIYTPADTNNYNTVYVAVSILVNKATLPVWAIILIIIGCITLIGFIYIIFIYIKKNKKLKYNIKE